VIEASLAGTAWPARTPAAMVASSMKRILDPFDRVSEIIFGVIMVMTFTSTFSVVEAYRLEARTMVVSALACNIAWGVVDAFMYVLGAFTERLRERQDLSAESVRPALALRDWLGAAAVFAFVFLSTLPLVIPFIVMSDPARAVRVSNLVALLMLFGCGVQLGRYTQWRPWRMGAAVAAVGLFLVVLTIALGG
jgi:VIT1/CCC1 family predicted Fe2+/Mn2+ transporter